MIKNKLSFAMAVTVAAVMIFGTVSASASSVVLKKESRGSAVTSLQKDLKRLGYLASEPTGYFGDATEAAVKEVQKEYGYTADGIVGNGTYSLIDRLLGETGTSTGTKTGTTATKTSSTTTITASLLKEGDESSSVKSLQNGLIKLGFLDTKATGFFGPATETAVKKLQKKYGYKADGIAGKATISLVNKLNSGVKVSTASGSTTAAKTTSSQTGSNKYLLPWYSSVSNIFARGDVATVYDIKTGLSYKIKRTYGTNHADCETLTAEDTAIMKKVFGGSWSWERRPVIVTVGNTRIAGSMTGYPHAGTDKYAANKVVSSRSGGYGRGTNLDAVKSNKMNGVFDIHFLGSKNHYNNRIDPKHQAVVKQAAAWAAKNY